MPRELFDATFQLVRETDKAICVTEGTHKDSFWLPKSQIEYSGLNGAEARVGSPIEVTMPVWLAKEKGVSGA